MPRVLTTADVVPGASVNIVLKADQPTGRTVAGTVLTLLTRGNHPRGIKVRLSDGRVGRVQSMADGAVTGNVSESRQATRTTASESGLPSEQIGLDAYMKRSKPRRKGKGADGGATGGGRQEEATKTPSEMVNCPVCGDFNGDEAAVAHHVATHFED